jgi:uncharacterized protein
MIRAVIDLNVLISALIVARGIPFSIWSAWQAQRFTMLTSEGMLDELADKLRLSRIARTYGVSEETAALTIALLRSQATLVPVPLKERMSVTGDPEDDLVLATGRLAHADYLVTGDKRLLALGHYAGMAIVSPRAFSDLLSPAANN